MIGVDIGITTTAVVETRGKRIRKALVAPSKKGIAAKLLGLMYGGDAVAITGAGAEGESASLRNVCDFRTIEEVGAIGIGGAELAGLRSCIVTSIGTGTAVVHKKNRKCTHLGGTGVGGGTIVGLGKRIIGTDNAELIAALAKKGKISNVNITVRDVYSGGVGIIPPDATASNFAKKRKCSKGDNALGIMSVVGETTGVLSCFAAREKTTDDIVFIGTVPIMEGMGRILQRTTSMFKCKCHIPEDAQLATALGAVLCLKYNIYIKKIPY